MSRCGRQFPESSCLLSRSCQVSTQATALREGKKIPDERPAALSRFTQVMFRTRGMPGRDDVQTFLDAGFKEDHIMQIILALAVKTLSNNSNHINQPGLDEAFAGHKWEN